MHSICVWSLGSWKRTKTYPITDKIISSSSLSSQSPRSALITRKKSDPRTEIAMAIKRIKWESRAEATTKIPPGMEFARVLCRVFYARIGYSSAMNELCRPHTMSCFLGRFSEVFMDHGFGLCGRMASQWFKSLSSVTNPHRLSDVTHGLFPFLYLRLLHLSAVFLSHLQHMLEDKIFTHNFRFRQTIKTRNFSLRQAQFLGPKLRQLPLDIARRGGIGDSGGVDAIRLATKVIR